MQRTRGEVKTSSQAKVMHYFIFHVVHCVPHWCKREVLFEFSHLLHVCVFCVISLSHCRCQAILRHSLSTLSQAALPGTAKCLWILMKQQLVYQCLGSTSLWGSHLFSSAKPNMSGSVVLALWSKGRLDCTRCGEELCGNINFCFIECHLISLTILLVRLKCN